jgi:predicted nucleic acid-binding protein
MAATATERAEPERRALVVDCSVTLPWFLFDEQSTLSESLLRGIERYELRAPGIWRLELANGLELARRRGRLSAAAWEEAVAQAARAPVRIDPEPPDLAGIARLAERHGLTAYDAAYLELALRRELPLATADAELAAAARAHGRLERVASNQWSARSVNHGIDVADSSRR